jgi:transposase-like protein
MASSTTAGDGGGRRWRQWTEQQARKALEELAASGESAAAFARHSGISPRRLAYWRKRLAESGKTAFVAVALPAATSARWIEVAAGGVVVRIREDLDVGQVARLVEAIGRQVGGAC